eukprot:3714976-Alexandrium_andersonii.AAC.1
MRGAAAGRHPWTNERLGHNCARTAPTATDAQSPGMLARQRKEGERERERAPAAQRCSQRVARKEAKATRRAL